MLKQPPLSPQRRPHLAHLLHRLVGPASGQLRPAQKQRRSGHSTGIPSASSCCGGSGQPPPQLPQAPRCRPARLQHEPFTGGRISSGLGLSCGQAQGALRLQSQGRGYGARRELRGQGRRGKKFYRKREGTVGAWGIVTREKNTALIRKNKGFQKQPWISDKPHTYPPHIPPFPCLHPAGCMMRAVGAAVRPGAAL